MGRADSAFYHVFQNAKEGCAGDHGFAGSGTVKLPDPVGMEGHCSRFTQPLTVPPCVLQTCANAFMQNLPFKLGKDRKQPGQGSTSRRCQIRFSPRYVVCSVTTRLAARRAEILLLLFCRTIRFMFRLRIIALKTIISSSCFAGPYIGERSTRNSRCRNV